MRLGYTTEQELPHTNKKRKKKRKVKKLDKPEKNRGKRIFSS